MCDNTLDNCDNTHKNYGNTRNKSCQLKLNDIDCHVNCHVEFGVQISVSSIMNLPNYLTTEHNIK